MTILNLTAPSLLHLGCVWAEQVCELGLTLQFPQIQMAAHAAPTLEISGACADIALDEAERLIVKYQRPLPASIEIETAIPLHMGLGGQTMLRESLRLVYQHWHNISGSFRSQLAGHAATHGGLILANDDGLIQRHAELPHDCPNDQDDWVIVLILPNTPADWAEDSEAQRSATLRRSVQPNWPDGTALFAAAEQRDFAAFAHALAAIHTANEHTLDMPVSTDNRTALDLLRTHGAAMAGRMLTGLGVFGLVQGGPASREVRAALQQHYGYFGPLIMASVCDGKGIRASNL